MNKTEYIEIIESIVKSIRGLVIKINIITKNFAKELPPQMVEYLDLGARAAEDLKIKLLLFKEIVADD